MQVLYVASEVFPFAKTGGLADVAAALPAALAKLGINIRILMPAYPEAIGSAPNPVEVARFDGLLGLSKVRLLETWAPDSGVPVWLVDCPQLYDRPGGIYADANGQEWPDNALRFVLLNHIVALVAGGIPHQTWWPDVIHINDWHTALVPLLLAQRPGSPPATLLTIHNLAFQGVFAPEDIAPLGVPQNAQNWEALEFYGRMSFLKAGIQHADALSTVSPTYAREILTPDYGCGLDGVLRARPGRLHGIMNGIDYGVWNPANDPHIAHPYSATSDLIPAKRTCKVVVQREMGLDASADVPLVAFMSRLAHQKMPDVVLEAMPALLQQGMQFALVAQGDADYEAQFQALAAQYPGRVAVRLDYEEPIAHRVMAGADMLLHPSRFEPCGLTPMYAMRYGTVPIVRRSGGLADSVMDTASHTIKSGLATGFAFIEASSPHLIDGVTRSLDHYRQPLTWRKIQACGMKMDFSWRRSAEAYFALYRSLVQPPFAGNTEDDESAQRLFA